MAIDHEMVQGDTVALDFSIVDAAGDAVDLTGATVRWQMSRSVQATAILSKSVGSGITVTNAAGGLFTVDLAPADTVDLAGTFYYEAEIIDASDNVSTVRTGQIKILPGLIGPL